MKRSCYTCLGLYNQEARYTEILGPVFALVMGPEDLVGAQRRNVFYRGMFCSDECHTVYDTRALLGLMGTH